MKQGNMSLESLWNKFQKLWISIDEKDPNPMDTPGTIEKYNNNTQRHGLYQFLWALDDIYNGIKREILNKDPLPSVRTAYGLVRRESANERVFTPSGDPLEAEIGAGVAAINRGRPPHQPAAKNFPMLADKSKLTCSHRGGRKHTTETCFRLHGFPEWWEDMKKSRQGKIQNGGSRATVAATSTGATIADNSAGSSGVRYNARSSDGKSGSKDGEEDKQGAIAFVLVAQVWSEGNKTSVINIAGVSWTSERKKEAADKSRVCESENWGKKGTARVRNGEGSEK